MFRGFAFLDPATQLRYINREKAREKRIFEENLPRAQPWSDDVKYEKVLVIKGETFNPELLFPEVKPGDQTERNKGVQHGEWTYRNVVIPAGKPLSLYRRDHVVYFTAPIVTPQILKHEHGDMKVWMSITPGELMSQRAGIRTAKGKVVVGGLGLGWALKKIAARPQVKEVILVEKSKDLMDWYGWELCAKIPKVKVVLGDVFEEAPKHNPDRCVIDTWEDYGDAYGDRRLLDLRKKGLKVWAWGEART